MEYKDEADSLRKQLADLEKKQNGGAMSNFGFAAPTQPAAQQRPGTPAFSFDPSQQSLI